MTLVDKTEVGMVFGKVNYIKCPYFSCFGIEC